MDSKNILIINYNFIKIVYMIKQTKINENPTENS